MITEFTCGIYRAIFQTSDWKVTVNNYTLATVSIDGIIKFEDLPVHLRTHDLIEITVLMNNIKRQYKQLNKN